MKLRVRLHRATVRVELPGDQPTVAELTERVRETVLSTQGISVNTLFSLSLNGSELLSDEGQTLSSCGIVSGDLICVLLPQEAANAAVHINPASVNAVAAAVHNNPAAVNPNAEVPNNNTNANNSINISPTRPTYSTESQQSSTRSHQPASDDQPCSSSSSLSPGARSPDQMDTAGSPDPLDGSPSSPPGLSYCSWEPMLCSETGEGKAPLSLELLFHSAHCTSPTDAVMVVGHLLMIETGFTVQDCDVKEMPVDWRSASGLYRLHYTHPLCENSLAMVVCVSMGPMLVINATLKVNETVDTVRKLCLNPSTYVTEEWPGESAAAAFKDLNKLSRIFKDQLAYPLIAAAREAMSLPVAFGLSALPPELLLRMLRLLDVRSVVRLSSVCRHFNAATDESTLWRHLYRRDFTDTDRNRSRDTDWKELYRRYYKIRIDNRHHVARHRSLPPFLRNPRDLFPPGGLVPAVPGIIGGEYDQRIGFPRGLLPRPRYDPIGPQRIGPDGRPMSRLRPGRPSDIRRGFI